MEVYVVNPWTGALVPVKKDQLTKEKLEAMAPLMDDEAREVAHSEHPEDPVSFWRRYVEIVGPEEAGKIWFS